MTFTIRYLGQGDLDEVVAIAAASPEAPQWPRSAYTAYLEPDRAQPALTRTGFAAIEAAGPGGGTPTPGMVGFAVATLLRVPDSDGAEVQLDSMAVYAGHRRHGIGAGLLREVLQWAAGSGARRISLEVRASNAAAIGLYRGFGLNVEGRRPRYYAHPEEDALLLGMAVTNGDSSQIFHHEIG